MEVGLLSLGACCCCKAGALNLKSCSNIHRFGYGWRVDERTFSVIKSLFGEYVTAKLVDMAKEMVMKASIYNGFVKAMVWAGWSGPREVILVRRTVVTKQSVLTFAF